MIKKTLLLLGKFFGRIIMGACAGLIVGGLFMLLGMLILFVGAFLLMVFLPDPFDYVENNPTTFNIIYFIILFGFGISCIYGSLTDAFLDDYLEWEEGLAETIVKRKEKQKGF